MKILITILLILSPIFKVISQNIDFERKTAIDSIVNKYAKEYSIVGLSIGMGAIQNVAKVIKCVP